MLPMRPTRFLAAGLLLGLACPASEAPAAAKAFRQKVHGAIALDRSSEAWGYGINFKTSHAARLEALKQCSQPTCEVVMRIEGECGAVARNKTPPAPGSARKYASSRGATRSEAETKALRVCGRDCEPVAWACNHR